jgi:hypothetical protein
MQGHTTGMDQELAQAKVEQLAERLRSMGVNSDEV